MLSLVQSNGKRLPGPITHLKGSIATFFLHRCPYNIGNHYKIRSTFTNNRFWWGLYKTNERSTATPAAPSMEIRSCMLTAAGLSPSCRLPNYTKVDPTKPDSLHRGWSAAPMSSRLPDERRLLPKLLKTPASVHHGRSSAPSSSRSAACLWAATSS